MIQSIYIKRVSEAALKHHVKSQISVLQSLRYKGIITEQQYQQGKLYLEKYKLNFMHSMLVLTESNTLTNQVIISLYPITQRPKDVTIVPSLVESYFGDKAQTCKLLIITDKLYLTSHCLVNTFLLQELKYDEEKGYFVDISNNNKAFQNLTGENVLKMRKIIENYKNFNVVKKIDTENAMDLVNEVSAIIYLEEFKKGTFNKNSYHEIQQEMDHINNKIMQLEREIKQEFEFNQIKTKEEL